MKNKYKEGFSSIEIIITLLVLSLLAIAFIYIINFYQLSVIKNQKNFYSENSIDNCFAKLDEAFKKLVEEENDGPSDELYNITYDKETDCKISIRSLSGLLDINYLPEEFYSTKYFKSILNEDIRIDFVNDYRNSNILITSYNELEDIFDYEKFNKYFTLFSLININVIDEKSLQTLCSVYSLSEDLINKRKALQYNNQFIQTETEALLTYGFNYEKLKPYVTIDSNINVNFIEEDLLKAFVSLQRFHVSNPIQKCEQILAQRNMGKINKESIMNTFNISKNDELYYYMGCKTFFWEVIISNNNVSCKYILFRDDKDIYLIQKKWI